MRKTAVVLLTLLCAFALCSCEKSEMLSDMTVVQAVGLDLEGEKVLLSVQFLDYNKGNGTSEGVHGNVTAVAQGRGVTITEAVASAQKTLSGRLFFGQNKLLIVSRDFMNYKGNELLSYLSSSKNSRPDVYILLSENAEKAVKNEQRGSVVPAETLLNQLLLFEKKNGLRVPTVADYINRTLSGRNGAYPYVRCYKDYTVIEYVK